jgi:hypothetical protein
MDFVKTVRWRRNRSKRAIRKVVKVWCIEYMLCIGDSQTALRVNTIILSKSSVGGSKVKLKYKGVMYSANAEKYSETREACVGAWRRSGGALSFSLRGFFFV